VESTGKIRSSPNSVAAMSIAYSAVVDPDGTARATVPYLKPGVVYKMHARVKSKGAPESKWQAWSSLSEGINCTLSSSSDSSPSPTLLSSQAQTGHTTTWLEVLRVTGGGTPYGQDGILPDYLQDQNSGDYVGMFGTQLLFFNGTTGATANAGLTGYITRYCVEILDVELPGITTTSTTGEATLSPFADYSSAIGNQMHCMVALDRLVSKLPFSNVIDGLTYHGHCPYNSENSMIWYTCICNITAMTLTHYYTGMAPIGDPFGVPTEALKLMTQPWYGPIPGTGYPWPNKGAVGAWYSHPLAGNCPHGTAVGTDGCTWRLAPQSWTRASILLKPLGFNATKVWNATAMRIPQKQGQQNVAAGKKLFEDLPPCGS